MVSVVAASRLVVVGESHLQAGQFVLEFPRIWLLIQRGACSKVDTCLVLMADAGSSLEVRA